MTDSHDDATNDARAEQAFRDALARRADSLEPAPLVTGRRGRPWAWWVAGAAAAAVVAASATFALRGADEPVNGPDLVAGTGTETLPPEEADDTRLIVYRDLQLAVPAGWATMPTPNPNGCDYPDEPFVSTYDPTQALELNLCVNDEKPRPPESFPTTKINTWVPNVQVAPVGASGESLPDGAETFEGWTLTRQIFGDLQVEVLTDAATADLVEPILASATTVDADQLGCATTSPAQSTEFVRPTPFDITSVSTVSSIVVCQYSRVEGSAGLVASAELTGDDARTELAAIQAAPGGGGPDHPENCIDDKFGDSALVLQLSDGDTDLGDLYVYYDWCFGNGIDDGTTQRALTADNCVPLFTGAVQQFSGDGSTFSLCHPQG